MTAQSETPGLGTIVTDRKKQKTIVDLIKGAEKTDGLVANKYLDWYTGKQAEADRWGVTKEGEAVNGKTGATITSAAICGGVHAVGHTAIEHLEELKNNSSL